MRRLATPAHQRGFGLFARLLLLALAVGVLPLVGLGFILIDQNAEALRTSSRTLHLAIAQDVQRSVRSHFARVDEELVGIGQLLLAPGLGDDDARLALAGSRVTASRELDAVTLYSPSGERMGTLKAREVKDPDVPERLTAAARDGLSIGEVRRTPAGPRLLVERAVRIEGALKGRLLAWIRLEPLCKLAGELGELRLGSRDAVFVVDGARRIVVAGDPGLLGEPQEGRGIFRAIVGNASFSSMTVGISPDFDESGSAMLGALEPLPELDWAVVAREPRDKAYFSLVQARRAVLLFIGIAAVLAALGGAFAAREITKPIGRLVRATRDIAQRSFTGVGAGVTSRGDEVGELGRSFDSMARDLGESEKKLIAETQVRTSLSRYLSPDVVDLIVRDPDRMRLQGERREITVLFADVCAFTSLSERLPAETIVLLLNELFTAAGHIVQGRGGIIDKFIGDCVMAVWGTPESHGDDPLRAVLAAEELVKFLREANPRWLSRFGVEIHLSMGINTGQAVAGNLGGEARMEYTVIGDAVNIAARLQSLAGPDQIVVSDSTAGRVGAERKLNHLGDKVLKGRSVATPIYEVIA